MQGSRFVAKMLDITCVSKRPCCLQHLTGCVTTNHPQHGNMLAIPLFTPRVSARPRCGVPPFSKLRTAAASYPRTSSLYCDDSCWRGQAFHTYTNRSKEPNSMRASPAPDGGPFSQRRNNNHPPAATFCMAHVEIRSMSVKWSPPAAIPQLSRRSFLSRVLDFWSSPSGTVGFESASAAGENVRVVGDSAI